MSDEQGVDLALTPDELRRLPKRDAAKEPRERTGGAGRCGAHMHKSSPNSPAGILVSSLKGNKLS